MRACYTAIVNPEIDLICFDMDDTLITQNSWYKLNLALGVTHEEDVEMYTAYESGTLSYTDWTHALLALYRKHGKASKSFLEQFFMDYELTDGASDVVHTLKEKGYELALVSGSFDSLVGHVADEFGIVHRTGSTTFVFDEQDQLIDIKTHGDEGQAKLRHLQRICAEVNIPIERCACIGDGANDREMFVRTGHGVTFPDSPVQDVAWKTVQTLRDVKVLF